LVRKVFFLFYLSAKSTPSVKTCSPHPTEGICWSKQLLS